MKEKETDPRVTQFIEAFDTMYKEKYSISPAWSGKQGTHIKTMWKIADKNNLQETEVYKTLIFYFKLTDEFVDKVKHDCVHFCNKFDKFYLAHKGKRAQEVFRPEVKNMDEILAVSPVTDFRMKDEIKSRYKTPEDLVKMLKFLHHMPSVQSKTGLVYDNWVKWWRIGCELWGKDKLKEIWAKKEVTIDLQAQIKKAKELEKISSTTDKIE